MLSWCSLQLTSKKHPAFFKKNSAVSSKLLLRKTRITRHLKAHSLNTVLLVIVYFLFIDQSVCELVYAAVHVCHLAYRDGFNKMHRVISLYIWSPEKKVLFQQHKCTQKADWTAENILWVIHAAKTQPIPWEEGPKLCSTHWLSGHPSP